MVNRNESEMLQGQITIFDFPEWLPGEKTRNKIVPEECKQCVDIGKIYDVNGEFEIDIYHCGIDGHPTKTESGKPGTKCIKNHVCKFSNHTCNKEELWKVAQSFDDIECKKVCCRQCSVRMCGARCNGSEEPKQEILEVSIRGMLDDGYCPKCNIWLDDLVEECPECHSKLDWTWWKKVNEVDE